MINLYSHGGSKNHGCEAIVRSTCSMLQQPIQLFSNNIEEDEKYNITEIATVIKNEKGVIKRGTKEWFTSSLETKLTKKYDLTIKYQHKKLLSYVKKGDLWLSIGGDNYCYEGTDLIAALNKCIRAKGAKTVLWGCSVEPEVLKNEDVCKDLSKFDLITARESLSYEVLKKVNSNTILVSDPAFTLERKDLKLPKGWKEGDMIGINASPLILDASGNNELVINAYLKMIEYILDNTSAGIALIPHVVWDYNNDCKVLNFFYEKYKDTGRVVLLEDYNCMELKGFIARCRMFIGARTHATIAAYSNNVPTLVLGYSIKSRGIARDLFGTEENYVIPVQEIKKDDELIEAFKWLTQNETIIRDKLKKIMPEYIERAFLAKKALEKLNEVVK